MMDKKVTENELTDIGHILANIAQKHKGMTAYRKQANGIFEAIQTLQNSIDVDVSHIWNIINRNGDEKKCDG